MKRQQVARTASDWLDKTGKRSIAVSSSGWLGTSERAPSRYRAEVRRLWVAACLPAGAAAAVTTPRLGARARAGARPPCSSRQTEPTCVRYGLRRRLRHMFCQAVHTPGLTPLHPTTPPTQTGRSASEQTIKALAHGPGYCSSGALDLCARAVSEQVATRAHVPWGLVCQGRGRRQRWAFRH